MESKDQTIAALKCDVTSSNQTLQDLELENLKKFNEEKKNNMILNRRTKELEVTVEKGEEVIAELEEKLELMKNSETMLNTKIESEQKQSSDRLKAMSVEVSTLKSQLSDLTTQINSLNLQLNDTNEKIFVCEGNLRKTETEKAQLEMDLEKSQTDLEKALEDCENLLVANNTLSSSEHELEMANKAHLTKIGILEDQLSELKEKSAKDEEEQYKSVVCQLEKSKTDMLELNAKLEIADKDNLCAKEEIRKLTEQCTFNEDSVSSLRTVVQELRSQAKENEVSLKHSQSELADKREEIMTLVTSNDNLKEELLTLQSEKDKIVTTTLRSDKEKVATLEATVSSLRTEIELMRESMNLLEKENEAVSKTLKTEQEKNIGLTQQLSITKTENASLAGHQNTKQKIHQTMNMKKEIAEQAEQIKQQQATIISLTNKLSVVQRETGTSGIGGLKKGSRRGAASALTEIGNERGVSASTYTRVETRASKEAEEALDRSAYESV